MQSQTSDIVMEDVAVLQEQVQLLQAQVQTLSQQLSELQQRLSPVASAETPEEREKKTEYMDWWPQTLRAYQETIMELVRVHTNNATVDVVSLCAIRVLLDKKLISLEEIADLTDVAQELGLEMIGIKFQEADPNQEISAEERYEMEGLQVWDGRSKSPS